MISEEEAIWAYRIILGRDPESKTVLARSMQVASLKDMRDALLGSAEYLARQPLGMLPSRWVLAPVFEGQRMMWVNLADRYVSLGCLLDSYEPVETQIVQRLLRPGATLLDIGCNLGWFTLLASTVIGESGHVHAFEPRPDTAERLQKTLDANGLRAMVTLHRQAVGAENGLADIVWHTASDNPGGSYLGSVNDGGEMAGASVEVITIDSLGLATCDFIKIDVEGAEYAALAGARALIERHRPIILSEVHSGQLRRVSGVTAETYVDSLNDLGYSCHLIDQDRMLDPIGNHADLLASGLCNVLFIPRERRAEVAAQIKPAWPSLAND